MKEFNLDRAVQEYNDYIKPILAKEQREKREECRINEANYRAMHRESRAEETAQWKKEHPHYDHQWYQDHKKHKSEYAKKYYQEHKQDFKERYEKNKEKSNE